MQARIQAGFVGGERGGLYIYIYMYMYVVSFCKYVDVVVVVLS